MIKTFTVWRPDYGQEREDGREIKANSPKNAAEEWAQRDDAESADYLIVRGNEANVRVWDGEQVYEFNVFGESVPEYRARPVKRGSTTSGEAP